MDPDDSREDGALLARELDEWERDRSPFDDESFEPKPIQDRTAASRRKIGFRILFLLCAATVVLLFGFSFYNLARHQQQPQEKQQPAPTSDAEHQHQGVDGSSPTPPPPPDSSSAPTGGAPDGKSSGDSANHDLLASVLPPNDFFDINKAEFVVSSGQPQKREYVFNITRGFGAPDGVNQSMILINGQTPGPLIEANSGDTIRVVVNNRLPDEGTSIHWHGIDQKDTVWMDGVAGITQCAIPPGQSFVYDFAVPNQRGTFWYHSHVGVQYADGLYGPFVIHDPDEKVPPHDDDKIIMIADKYHTYGKDLDADYLSSSPSFSPGSPGMEPPPENIIINGRHVFNCSVPSSSSSMMDPDAGHGHGHGHGHGMRARDEHHSDQPSCSRGHLYATRVKSQARVRFRLISHSSNLPYWFSLDNHTLEIVEVDGVEVEPIATSRVYMNPGQRYSVIFTADQKPGNYLMRAEAARHCYMLGSGPHASLAGVNFQGTGIMSYDDVDPLADPIGTGWDLERMSTEPFGKEPWTQRCGDLPFDLPKPMRQKDAHEVGERNFHYIEFESRPKGDGYRYYVNNTVFEPLANEATIWAVPQQNLSAANVDSEHPKWDFGADQFVLVSRDSGKGAQIVINSENMMTHPWHLHGQNFQVVGWGKGKFGQGRTTWNLKNPLRRDTVTIPGNWHVVIRFLTDNPGVWALHCHIQWHAEGGMFVSTAQRLDALQDMVKGLGLKGKYCSSDSRGRIAARHEMLSL